MRDREHQRLLIEAARLQARLEAHRDLLLGDPEFMEAMRARSWLRADRTRVQLGADGQSVVCPDEWPEGIDPRAYATRYLETRERRAELASALHDLEEDA